jgi:hypothetical protein
LQQQPLQDGGHRSALVVVERREKAAISLQYRIQRPAGSTGSLGREPAGIAILLAAIALLTG